MHRRSILFLLAILQLSAPSKSYADDEPPSYQVRIDDSCRACYQKIGELFTDKECLEKTFIAARDECAQICKYASSTLSAAVLQELSNLCRDKPTYSALTPDDVTACKGQPYAFKTGPFTDRGFVASFPRQILSPNIKGGKPVYEYLCAHNPTPKCPVQTLTVDGMQIQLEGSLSLFSLPKQYGPEDFYSGCTETYYCVYGCTAGSWWVPRWARPPA